MNANNERFCENGIPRSLPEVMLANSKLGLYSFSCIHHCSRQHCIFIIEKKLNKNVSDSEKACIYQIGSYESSIQAL